MLLHDVKRRARGPAGRDHPGATFLGQTDGLFHQDMPEGRGETDDLGSVQSAWRKDAGNIPALSANGWILQHACAVSVREGFGTLGVRVKDRFETRAIHLCRTEQMRVALADMPAAKQREPQRFMVPGVIWQRAIPRPVARRCGRGNTLTTHGNFRDTGFKLT